MTDLRPSSTWPSFQHRAEALEGDGAVERVRMADGSTIDCDFVVVGIGVTPRTALAEAAGIEVDNGIVVNERLETGVPGIFAAGDVANAWHPFYGRRIRVEHWANARHQGSAAARGMLGQSAPTTGCPTSIPISTTWEWSTPVTRRTGMRSYSVATRSGASSSPSGWRPVVWWAARTSTSKESPDAIQALIRSGESVDAALARPGRGAGRPRLNSAERTWDCACNG